jgi:hypothetical protein
MCGMDQSHFKCDIGGYNVFVKKKTQQNIRRYIVAGQHLWVTFVFFFYFKIDGLTLSTHSNT